MEDRNADCWEPLIAVADAAGGLWPARARHAALHFVAQAQDSGQSLNVRLLADLRTVFDDLGEDHLPTAQILDKLHALEDAPWSNMRGGLPLDARGLSTRLRKYQIKPVVVRTGDKTPRGYRREDLHTVWERYLPPVSTTPQEPATSATSATHDELEEPDTP